VGFKSPVITQPLGLALMACSRFADSLKHRGLLSGPFRADGMIRAGNPGLHPGLSHAAPMGPRFAATRPHETAQGNALGLMVNKILSPEGASQRWGRPFKA